MAHGLRSHLLVCLALVVGGCEGGIDAEGASPTAVTPAESSASPGQPVRTFAQETFVHYQAPTHAGAGPHPTTESSDFRFTQGGARWAVGDPVEYQVIGAPPEWAQAVEAAEEAWDGLAIAREFIRSASPSEDPCGGSNTVRWMQIDGAGGVLGRAFVCLRVATKEILGFQIEFDAGDTWSLDGTGGTLSIGNVAAHEWGHVMGLAHVNAPRTGCLTMYRYSDVGETQKSTLGLGDKLGMVALYGPGDTSAGECGA